MVLRTTVITGFPGETDAEFESMLTALAELEFDNLGAFAYSTEDGTPAGAMEGQVPEAVRDERRDRVMTQQRRISLRRNRARIGRVYDVLVDAVEAGGARGRWTGQAPEIDGHVTIRRSPASQISSGELVAVQVEGAGPYDLIARPESVVQSEITV